MRPTFPGARFEMKPIMFSSSSSSILFFPNVLRRRSFYLFWSRFMTTLLSPAKLHRSLTILIYRNLTRAERYFTYSFSTVVGKGLVPFGVLYPDKECPFHYMVQIKCLLHEYAVKKHCLLVQNRIVMFHRENPSS